MVKVELTLWVGPTLLNQRRFGEKENTILQEVRKVFPEPNKSELSVYFNLGYSSSTYFFLDGNMDGET